MSDMIDGFAEDVKRQIYEETKEAYGETAYQRWRNPLYVGRMSDPDGHGCLGGVCGDAVEIFLKIQDDRVVDASFISEGCGSSTVCASFAAEMSIGKKPSEILEITGEAIVGRLGGLPKEDMQCAFQAAQTLHLALNDYLEERRGTETG